jgi:prepilin-type N-terminal cleavage/methylation domain-containing protein
MLERRRRAAQGGYTIIEVLIAMAVLVVAVQAFTIFIKTAARDTTQNRLKAEANEHALQMLEELRNVVSNNSADIRVLDSTTYNDGRTATGVPNYKFTLTTKANITHPGGNTLPDFSTGTVPLSGNPVNGKGYTFIRHVDIVANPLDLNERKIQVRVWAAAPNLGPTAPSAALPASSNLPLAEIFGTVHSLAQGSQPTQVMDVYLIELENVPGWWSRTSNLIPLMEASLITLQASNPGLVLRSHSIRRLSYGRDVEYTPEINSATLSNVTGALQKTYVYPGYIPYDDSNDYYYLPTWFKGRINMDGTLLQGGSDPVDGYPIADQWNHAMRLPDEMRYYAIHQQVNANRGIAAPEISLRMLLEKLNNPADNSMTNSIIINLHGEMVPVVPLRNYSDAAKDPAYFWGGRGSGLANRAWRMVSHPEQISYSAGSNVALRVYAYDMNAGTYADPITPSVENDVINYATVFVPNANLTNLAELDRMQGNSQVTYAWKRSGPTTYTAGVSNWQVIYPNGITTYADASTTYTARFWADVYNPLGSSRAGLRIVMQGITPTARAYVNLPYLP